LQLIKRSVRSIIVDRVDGASYNTAMRIKGQKDAGIGGVVPVATGMAPSAAPEKGVSIIGNNILIPDAECNP
jgi:hypothetical protein